MTAEPPQASNPSEKASGVLSGAFVTILLWFTGAFVWGAMFDSTGGEPFSSTLFGGLFVYPLHLFFIILGALVWANRPGSWRRLVVFFVLLILSVGLWGIGWSLYR